MCFHFQVSVTNFLCALPDPIRESEALCHHHEFSLSGRCILEVPHTGHPSYLVGHRNPPEQCASFRFRKTRFAASYADYNELLWKMDTFLEFLYAWFQWPVDIFHTDAQW